MSKLTLDHWENLKPGINGEFILAGFIDVSDDGLPVLNLQTNGPADRERSLRSLLEHCARHFVHVVVHVGIEVILPSILECMSCSTRVYLLGSATEEDFYHRELLLREPPTGQEPNAQIKTIVCWESEARMQSELLRASGRKVDGNIHGCPPAGVASSATRWTDRHFNADIRRLAREITRRRIGLALSSGGARGLAHIGVIQVLEENGIEVDALVGCSMGAYIGAVWAYGYDGDAMERLAREVEHRWGLFELIDPFILPRQGFLRGEKVKMRLKRSIGDVHFAELIRPLRIVATHLATLGKVVFSSGEVAQAVHASSAIPGACIPVDVNGELFIDGGIADPLPVDVLEEMGIEKIIAVNTIPTPEYLRSRLEIEKERNARHGRRASKIKTFINRYLNYFAPGNVLDTILRSFNGAQMQVAEHSGMFADLVLRPLSFDGRWHDFRRPGKYIAIGRREAEQHLDEIKALVNRKEPIYETAAAHHSLGAPA
ncbi:MAG TPA: patatin-like phospholipase family protein [Verrucomicrobiae bacterium]|nr:patatin-like phospholipase family protein [Verrucomicrobiae bacterium]